MSSSKHIILFDGDCNFCNYWVNFVIKRDKADVFRFASLQSEIGGRLLLENGLKKDLSSVVFFSNDKIYIKSEAALKIGQILGGVYSISILGWIVPKILRDFSYDVIAKNRKKLLKNESCKIPSSEMKNKFLN